jgi:hypothetical protein
MRNRSSKLLAALAVACGVAAAQPSAADQTASVAGRVTNSVGGEGILRAHVSLRPQGDTSQQSYGAITDAEGKFSILRVPPGNYNASVEKVGYQPAANPMFGAATMVRLAAGDKKEDVALKLTPGGAITGRITDSNGEPMEGAQVKISGSGNDGAVTDEKGQYRVGGLRPGKYRVWAFDGQSMLPIPPEARSDGTEETTLRLTYYPDSGIVKTAAIVTVTPGVETSGIDIRLLRAPTLRVSGKVTGLPKGVRATVQLQGKTFTGRVANGMVKADATFEVWRPDPGIYRVLAMWQGGPSGMMQTAPVDVEVSDSNIENLDLRVIVPFEVAGTIQYESDDAKPPEPDAKSNSTRQISAQPDQQSRPATAAIMLQDAFSNYGRQLRSPLKPDGSFSIKQVPPGTYIVTFSWGAYAKSMQLGPTHIDGHLLDLRNGTGDSPLSILAGVANGEVSGSVRSGADVAPGRLLVLIADPPEGNRPAMQRSNPDGTFLFRNLAPGKYKMTVMDVDDQSQNPYDRADFDDATEITLLPGDKITKDVTVKPSAQ